MMRFLGRVGKVLLANAGTIVLLIVLAGSLSLNVWLGRAEVARRKGAGIGRIKLDSVLPDIAVVSLDGAKAVFQSSAALETVVYVLSPSCGWCASNHANIVALGEQLRGKYRIVGLSTSGSIEDLRNYLAKRPLPFEVFLIDRKLAGDLPLLDATPLTLLLKRSGEIARAWMGAFADGRHDQVEAEFGVKLPGLIAATARSAGDQ